MVDLPIDLGVARVNFVAASRNASGIGDAGQDWCGSFLCQQWGGKNQGESE